MKPGDYDLEIVKVQTGRTRKGVEFFAAQFKVLGATEGTHDQGEFVDWFCGKDKDGFLSNVKEFARAVLQNTSAEPVRESDITEEVMEGIVAHSGEMVAGMKVKCRVIEKPVKSRPGSYFSRHYWYPGEVAPAEV